ncbi:MAG: ABC transporter permease [Rhizobiales bacterium]|nr:ABC transporter permease [Hyphomicrobiales bacterium]OJY45052.1 MAG: ABC transporter permease [Rhizobiales bacterium 64-17]
MSLYELLGTVEVGLVFGLVAFGAYLSFKVLDFPDLTVEGSFPLGGAVCATLIAAFGWNPWLATLGAAAAGFAAGWITAYLNVRFNILHILAGILVAIALYSVNLRIMDGPNKPLLNASTVFSGLEGWGVPTYMLSPALLLIMVIVIKIALGLFLHTGVGLGMRAAGANPAMAEANGVNVGRMKLMGIGLANALTGMAGGLFAQIFGAADAYMGIGVIIIGLASVIVGMSLMPTRTVAQAIFACLIGALLYRFAVALSLNADFLGLKASDVQLVTAILVVVTLVSQSSRSGFGKLLKRKPR